ncbi:hypothetical protein [Paenibacillus sp. FJAT-26967]|uniref:hypothetical protein n=1 Tax=Paenibacillus sp. FJAT-26967 TaxID=1729690 RepID=UPI0008390CDE|nr:hypothetical protein [Paenibacillus sp. FJAT-26967]
MKKWITLLLVAGMVVLGTTRPTQAQARQELALPSEMPAITLLDEFTLYSSSTTRPSEAIGALSSLQSVRLAPIERNQLLGITAMDKVKVVTWLGDAWINLKEGAYKYGELEVKEQTITLLEQTTSIYDSPMKMTPYGLSPQKVQAIASIGACDPYTPCYSEDKWYLIRTSWLGDKWIRPYHYAEKYTGNPVEGMIAIAEESEVYQLPFEKPLIDEPKVTPQVVKPVSKHVQLVRMVPPSVWYQIETPKGLRWIGLGTSGGLGFEGVEQVDLELNMPVPFHYYSVPFDYADKSSIEQPQQTVHALGKRDDWYFVLSEGSGKWINPAKAVSSKLTGDLRNDAKLGVKQITTHIELTETSVALDIPYVNQSTVNDGLAFTPQTVTASRVWESPNGETWYYIQTWKGAKWVRPQ